MGIRGKRLGLGMERLRRGRGQMSPCLRCCRRRECRRMSCVPPSRQGPSLGCRGRQAGSSCPGIAIPPDHLHHQATIGLPQAVTAGSGPASANRTLSLCCQRWRYDCVDAASRRLSLLRPPSDLPRSKLAYPTVQLFDAPHATSI